MGNGVVGNIVAFDQMGKGAATFGQIGIGEASGAS
jgi:hypothetical protein